MYDFKLEYTFSGDSLADLDRQLNLLLTTRAGTMPLDRAFGLEMDYLDKPVIPDTFICAHCHRELPEALREAIREHFPKASLVEPGEEWLARGDLPPVVREAADTGRWEFVEEYLTSASPEEQVILLEGLHGFIQDSEEELDWARIAALYQAARQDIPEDVQQHLQQ